MYESPRHRFTLCRAALRSALCQELGCRNEHLAFRTSQHGKPYAIVRRRRAPISFNVSHSGAHGLIALASGRQVGIDVEERLPHRNLDELIDAVFGPNEKHELSAANDRYAGDASAGALPANEKHELSAANDRDRLHLFFRLWTMKEALSKADGMGLSSDVSRFEIPQEVRSGATSGSVRLAGKPGIGWRLEDISTDRFAAAVAYEDGRRWP